MLALVLEPPNSVRTMEILDSTMNPDNTAVPIQQSEGL